jgi:thiamine pyrophosphate-dependent acetolactate synthase large subunit-like protein
LGIRVEQPADISAAIRQGLAADRPTVIEVMTDIHCHAPNPWSPGA